VSIPSRHPEVAEPQPNRSMQDLECYPAFGSSGSIHRGDEGSPLTPTLSRRARGKKAAFTLAEVLITLAIIGVVAAMTIPTLVQGYKKKVVETRLQKFHATFLQVFKMSEIENGQLASTIILTPNESIETVDAWHDKYVRPYVKYSKSETVKVDGRTRTIYHLADGSVAVIPATNTTIFFFPFGEDFYMNNIGTEEDPSYSVKKEDCGIKWFDFSLDTYHADDKHNIFHTSNKGWDGTIEMLKNDSELGCNKSSTVRERAYCTKWIEMNGWKIPEDYPFKF